MRTETRTYTLYRITELSEEAKEKAHNEWLCNRYFYGWTHENRQTLDTFCERFGIVCRNWRYDACNYSYDYRSRQEDCIDGLNGWRLAVGGLSDEQPLERPVHAKIFLERDERTKKQDICRCLLSPYGLLYR